MLNTFSVQFRSSRNAAFLLGSISAVFSSSASAFAVYQNTCTTSSPSPHLTIKIEANLSLTMQSMPLHKQEFEQKLQHNLYNYRAK